MYICICDMYLLCIQTMPACFSSVFAKYVKLPSKTKTKKEIHTLSREIAKQIFRFNVVHTFLHFYFLVMKTIFDSSIIT